MCVHLHIQRTKACLITYNNPPPLFSLSVQHPHQQTVRSVCVAPKQQRQVRKHATSFSGGSKCKVPCGVCVVGMSLSPSTSSVHPASPSNGFVTLPQTSCVQTRPRSRAVGRCLAVQSKEMDESPQTSSRLVVLIKLSAFISGMYRGNGSQDMRP